MKVSSNADRVVRGIRNTVKQLRFAMAVALTKTAYKGKDDVRDEMARVFDRPKSFTLNSIGVTSATKGSLTAAVFIKDGPIKKYALMIQSEGGARHNKGFEKALRSMGVLAGGQFVAPAAGAQLDAYGGVSRGQITRIMSDVSKQGSAFVETKRKQRRSTAAYFALPHGRGKLKPGIYMRKDDSILPVFHFVGRPTYKAVFNFNQVMEESVTKNFPAIYDQQVANALASAR